MAFGALTFFDEVAVEGLDVLVGTADGGVHGEVNDIFAGGKVLISKAFHAVFSFAVDGGKAGFRGVAFVDVFVYLHEVVWGHESGKTEGFGSGLC